MALSSARRGVIALALALGVFPVGTLPSLLEAQATTGTVRGRVTDAASGRGLPEAQVSVEGTRLGALTGPNGDFTIANVSTGQRTIVVRRIGYAPATRAVAVTTDVASTGDIPLTASAMNLS